MDMKTQSPESRLATLTGNEAAAEACKLARVGVVGFFPIGPSDEMGEKLVQMIRRGELDARIIDLESERSVINAQIVAAQAGVRTTFATNSEGLVFAYQPLFWAAYGRVPIVVHVAHRAMEPPTIITTDDHDTIIFRDAHWLQFHCENAQDVFDTTLQAYRIAEDHDVLLPAFVTYAGWEVSHASLPVTLPSQEQVDAYLPSYRLPSGNDPLELDMRELYSRRRVTSVMGSPEYMELRGKIDQVLNVTAKEKIRAAHREFVQTFGRGYGGLAEEYHTEGADVVIAVLGSIATTTRDMVDEMRAEGLSVGMLKVRTLRPFPLEEVQRACIGAKVVLALDRNPVYTLYQEIRSVLYGQAKRPIVMGRVIALGGRNFTAQDVRELALEAFEMARTGRGEELAWRFRVAKSKKNTGRTS
jgi:pyruvate ferredoxin oxidoreductase alpha subunit